MTHNYKCENLLKALHLADEIAQDLACISGITAEGRKAKSYGEKLHKIVTAAIAKAERSVNDQTTN